MNDCLEPSTFYKKRSENKLSKIKINTFQLNFNKKNKYLKYFCENE